MLDNKAFFKLSYGLYIVSSMLDSSCNGQIANTFFQVTSDPPMVAVSINKQNLTHKLIHESGLYSISVLSVDTPMEFIGKFGFKSGKEYDKFLDTEYKFGNCGVPIVLENTVTCFEVEVEKEIDIYTHTIFIGRVTSAEVISDKEQMTYDYYHKVKKGMSPKNAPTYINTQGITNDMKDNKNLDKYVCTICGYVYDPELGDPDINISPGTPFENLPDNWVCPICGAPKEQFNKE